MPSKACLPIAGGYSYLAAAPSRLPFFCCPTAGHRMFHNRGEKATAAAAARKGILFGLSTLATTSVEEIGKIFPPELPKVFQCYLWKDKGLNRALLQQARENGYDAVALTADFTWFGKRERDIRNGFSVPPSYSFRQIWEAAKRPAWTWDLLCNDVYTYVTSPTLSHSLSLSLSPIFALRSEKTRRLQKETLRRWKYFC